MIRWLGQPGGNLIAADETLTPRVRIIADEHLTCAPRDGVHNSGWVQSPGMPALQDPSQYARLEAYVRGVVGRFGKETMSADELDKVLGQVLEAADGDFNTLLEIGFATSIKREWDWRVSRGESLANLQAFKHLVAPEKPHEPGLTES